MFSFFRRKRLAHAVPVDTPLVFKDGLGAFEQACGMECPLDEGTVLPAIVLDAREFLGAVNATIVQNDGCQIATVRVASRDGGFIVSASTSGPRGPRLEPGRLVAWQAERFDTRVAKGSLLKGRRSRWIGLIIGTLKSEYTNGGWVGDERFSS
ncbi:MAG TPA: hypothetical protein VKG63_17080 [Steroidobacteraceae bacterium]|nr:hypothetical protein [Steroidobacteraceae bacterium]